MSTVTLSSSWKELFPANATAHKRRSNWATWLRLARQVIGCATRQWAGRQERCVDCVHARGGWCVLQSLPCTFNPSLTPRTGLGGMACMGLGFQPRQLGLGLSTPGESEVH